jgi:hypothetical protein
MFRLSRAILAVALLLLPACAMQRAEDAATAKRRLAGLTKEQVFACMGLPKRKGMEGGTEIWLYRSGNDRTQKNRAGTSFDSLGATFGFSEDVTERRYCNIQIVMREGVVRTVHYTGPTGGFLTDDEQCAYAVRNCLTGKE